MTRDERLEFLTDYLCAERGEKGSERRAGFSGDQFGLFRALVNTREPAPASGEFLLVQDELLKNEIAAKGVTDAAHLSPMPDIICLWRGDITTLKADAVVNAANSSLLGCFKPNHLCIDNAIHTYAGIQLRLECSKLMRAQRHSEPPGRAKLTSAYNLPSGHVIHTVGPITDGSPSQEQRRLLASCYRACLETAKREGLKSLAFCCISTGEFRFPNGDAARIAVDTVAEFLNDSASLERVVFNVFKETDLEIYRRLLT